jgi:hypothetical protein
MTILRYENSLAGLFDHPSPAIFLAGPTVRGTSSHLTSWRTAAIDEFARQSFAGTLIVPEFADPSHAPNDTSWIPAWEFAALCACDIILFWIPRTRQLIGLTTNHEHGYWLAKMPRKVVYGRPDDSYRNAYLDQMWRLDAAQTARPPRPIHTTLATAVRESIALASPSARHNRLRSPIPVNSPFGTFQI